VLAWFLRERRVPATAAAALAVWSPALVGHTKAYEPVPLLVVTDALHLSAGAIWLGGLVGLALTLPAIRGRRRDTATVVSRFSTVAAGVLALLVASGTLTGWRILGSWDALFGTTYGRLLIVKVGIALLVVAIAAWNRYRLLPRVSTAVGHDEGLVAAGLVRRTVVAEACLLLAVLGVTGFLVNQPPREQPEAAAPRPGRVESVVVGDLRVLATLTPGKQGPNTVTVQIQDQAGDPVDAFAAPEVSLASDEVDLGVVPVTPVGAGTYAAEAVIPAPGVWRVQVSLKASEFDNPVVTLSFDV
jgi:copper transport protein